MWFAATNARSTKPCKSSQSPTRRVATSADSRGVLGPPSSGPARNASDDDDGLPEREPNDSLESTDPRDEPAIEHPNGALVLRSDSEKPDHQEPGKETYEVDISGLDHVKARRQKLGSKAFRAVPVMMPDARVEVAL